MIRKFDIRDKTDLTDLADLLPIIDKQKFDITKDVFIFALEKAAYYLGNPDWLTYEFGCFLFYIEKFKLLKPFMLKDIVELGLQLDSLSLCNNFETLIKGFSNDTQLLDTIYEVKVASYLNSLDSIQNITFSPECNVKNHIKTPDMMIKTHHGYVYVECKNLHFNKTKAFDSINNITHEIRQAMAELNLIIPNDLRIEVEQTNVLKKDIKSQAKIIATDIRNNIHNMRKIIKSGPFNIIISKRLDNYRLKGYNYCNIIMQTNNEVATLNDRNKVELLVVNNYIENKVYRTIGNLINKALSQLPNNKLGLIFIGGVSEKFVKYVSQNRLNENAYDKVLSIIAFRDEIPIIYHRDTDTDLVNSILKKLDQ